MSGAKAIVKAAHKRGVEIGVQRAVERAVERVNEIDRAGGGGPWEYIGNETEMLEDVPYMEHMGDVEGVRGVELREYIGNVYDLREDAKRREAVAAVETYVEMDVEKMMPHRPEEEEITRMWDAERCIEEASEEVHYK